MSVYSTSYFWYNSLTPFLKFGDGLIIVRPFAVI